MHRVESLPVTHDNAVAIDHAPLLPCRIARQADWHFKKIHRDGLGQKNAAQPFDCDIFKELGNRNSSALFGFESGKILGTHMFKESRACLLGFQGGFGLNDTINASDPPSALTHTTTDLANTATNEPPIGFYILSGSYFGDFNFSRPWTNNLWTNNNFFRATLATPNYGLAAIWTRQNLWQLQPLGLGRQLGRIVCSKHCIPPMQHPGPPTGIYRFKAIPPCV